MALREWLKTHLDPGTIVRLRCITRGYPVPRWGNLRRVRPFSENFGFERGGAIDRYYLERFLERERQAITGRVLEIQAPDYARRYGHALTAADSIDISPAPAPTYVCDLATSDGVIPSASYDCVLLPNTLNALRDVEACLEQALRIVRPGGSILATGAALVPLMPDAPDYRRLSAQGWREVVSRVWPGEDVRVEAHGNCLAAVAAMLALAHEELSPAELDVHDARYPVLVTIACRRTRA